MDVACLSTRCVWWKYSGKFSPIPFKLGAIKWNQSIRGFYCSEQWRWCSSQCLWLGYLNKIVYCSCVFVFILGIHVLKCEMIWAHPHRDRHTQPEHRKTKCLRCCLSIWVRAADSSLRVYFVGFFNIFKFNVRISYKSPRQTNNSMCKWKTV